MPWCTATGCCRCGRSRSRSRRSARRRRRYRGSRRPATRVMAVTGAGAVLLAAAVGGYEGVQVGRTLYFFEKSLHAVIVLLLIGSGAAAGLAQRVLAATPVRHRAAPLACAVALGLVP